MSLALNRSKIKRIATARGITRLRHFTPYQNLESILTHGLINRRFLEENDQGIDTVGTDVRRLDGFKNTISTTIEAINHAMLAKKIKEGRGDWAILSLEPDILWTQTCRFCWDNAASNAVKRYRYLNDAKHFEAMYEDRDFLGGSWREHRGLHDSRPTEPGAEVMVFDHIAPEKIMSITVQNYACKTHLERRMANNDQMWTADVDVCFQDFC
jgi:hypothetical protein